MAVSPTRRATQALRDLRQLGSTRRADGARAYFKSDDRVEFFGVTAPQIRRLAAEIRREANAWTLDEAIRFAAPLIARPELEAKGVGICVLGRFRRSFDDSMLQSAKRWLREWCHDWASTDNLCGDVLGPLLLDRPHLVSQLRAWRTDRGLYVRRASAVALVPLARKGIALDEVYAAATALAHDREDLIQKAIGWLLREAGKTDGARLEAFLRRSGHRFGRTTVRYAIERFPPGLRRDLLAATKARVSVPRRQAPARSG